MRDTQEGFEDDEPRWCSRITAGTGATTTGEAESHVVSVSVCQNGEPTLVNSCEVRDTGHGYSEDTGPYVRVFKADGICARRPTIQQGSAKPDTHLSRRSPIA